MDDVAEEDRLDRTLARGRDRQHLAGIVLGLRQRADVGDHLADLDVGQVRGEVGHERRQSDRLPAVRDDAVQEVVGQRVQDAPFGEVLRPDREVLPRDAVALAGLAVAVRAVLGERGLAALQRARVDARGPAAVTGALVAGAARGGGSRRLGRGDGEADEDADQHGRDGRTTDDGGSSDAHVARQSPWENPIEYTQPAAGSIDEKAADQPPR